MRRSLAAILLTAAALASVLHAQNASYAYINQKAPYTNPTTASFTAVNLPKLGTTFQLKVPYSWVQRNQVGADFLLATGIANPNVPIAALGGYLYALPLFIVPTPMSPLGIPGSTTMNLPIPNDVALMGLNFHQQILEIPSKVPTVRPPLLSRGGHGVIGR